MAFRVTLIFYFVFFCTLLSAQILGLNQPLFSEVPFFNSSFIHQNNIKIIKGSRSTKKVQDIIRTKGLDYAYQFDKSGKLIKQSSTFLFQKQNKDTTVITYFYSNNDLILKRKSDNYGYFSFNYILNDSHQIIKQMYSRDENMYSSKQEFKLAKQFIITSDSFSYQKISPLQTEQIFYNNYNKPYKTKMIINDKNGYLIEEYTKYIIGNNKSRTTYKYNEKGWLIEKTTNNYNSKLRVDKEIYDYDELGNIQEIKYFEGDGFKTKKQFLYDKKNMLLSAQIIQDIASQFLEIIQYSYTFY